MFGTHIQKIVFEKGVSFTMGSTQRSVLAVLRKALWDEDIAAPFDTNWRAVFEELKSQKVATLPGNVLKEYIPDPSLKQEWAQAIIHQISSNDRYYWGQDQLLTLLKAHNTPTVILKGASAAQYYPNPEYRTMGDVDFLVSKDRFVETLSLLLSHGYEQCSELIEGYCEVALQKNGIRYELHCGMDATDSRSMDKLNALIAEGLSTPKMRIVMEHCFPSLPDVLNGLTLLTHIRQHMRSGLGMRQIIDWMLYVKHSMNDSVWYNSFQSAAKECGLEKLAITVTRMCQVYLGLTEDITWCTSADEALCGELMDYIFMSGNFGQKIDKYCRATQRIMMQKNYLWEMLTSLQRKGKSKPIVKKHSFLRPFAWAVQISHYIHHTVRRGNVVKTLSEDTKKSHQLQEMLEALEIKPE